MAFQVDGAFHVTVFQVVGVSDWVEQLKRIRAKAGVGLFRIPWESTESFLDNGAE
jgi:hypothetical protein